jgi:hypothetical protein
MYQGHMLMTTVLTSRLFQRGTGLAILPPIIALVVDKAPFALDPFKDNHGVTNPDRMPSPPAMPLPIVAKCMSQAALARCSKQTAVPRMINAAGRSQNSHFGFAPPRGSEVIASRGIGCLHVGQMLLRASMFRIACIVELHSISTHGNPITANLKAISF